MTEPNGQYPTLKELYPSLSPEELQIAREKALSASQLASIRRSLADSVTEERPIYERAALASD